MRRRPFGITIIAALYFCGAAGYSAMLLTWIFSREAVVNWIERISPTESLGPILLLQMATTVSLYFLTMALFCGVVGNALWKLQKWSWIVTVIFLAFSFVFDISLLLHVRQHLSPWLMTLGMLRLAFLATLLGYLTTSSVRGAFVRSTEMASSR